MGDYDVSEYVPSDFYTLNEDPLENVRLADKRSSLFRFGKKSRDMSSMFGRNAEVEKKPHTPWRFGREEDYIDYKVNKQ